MRAARLRNPLLTAENLGALTGSGNSVVQGRYEVGGASVRERSRDLEEQMGPAERAIRAELDAAKMTKFKRGSAEMSDSGSPDTLRSFTLGDPHISNRNRFFDNPKSPATPGQFGFGSTPRGKPPGSSSPQMSVRSKMSRMTGMGPAEKAERERRRRDLQQNVGMPSMYLDAEV